MAEDDVSATLNELERKLQELENELQGSAVTPSPPSQAPAAAVGSASPPPAPPAPAADEEIRRHLDELAQFRDELERSTQGLMQEYERVLRSLRVSTEGAADATATQAGAWPVSTPLAAPRAGPPPPPAPDGPPTPWRQAPGSPDDAVMDGAITVDAGPFGDITVLSGFEQALGEVPGVREVYVRGFEGSRAVIDVTLGQPVAFGHELRQRSPVAFTITGAEAGRLSIAVKGG